LKAINLSVLDKSTEQTVVEVSICKMKGNYLSDL